MSAERKMRMAAAVGRTTGIWNLGARLHCKSISNFRSAMRYAIGRCARCGTLLELCDCTSCKFALNLKTSLPVSNCLSHHHLEPNLIPHFGVSPLPR